MGTYTRLSTSFLGESEAEASLRFDSEGALLEASASAARLFGFESVDVLRRETGEFGPAGLLAPENTRLWVQRVLQKGDVIVEDRALQRRSGIAFPCRLVAGPWFRNGQVGGVHVVLNDRTSRETIHSFVAAIMDALPNAVFIKDSAHRWVALNDAYCKLQNCTPEERLGKSDHDFHPANEAALYWQRDDLVFQTGEIDENEEPWTDAKGHVHVFITRKSRHYVAGQPFLVGVMTDITERKEMEEELRRSRAELERRVQERTLNLERANQRLETLHRRNDEFISVLSHELRNPLSPISNSIYLLQRNPSLDERGRSAAAVIQRQVRHLARLVSDLLDVTRVAHGKAHLKKSRIDLSEVVRRTLEDHATLLQRRTVIQDLPPQPLWVYGDETRLVQITGNLVENAVKFTADGGTVRISVRQAGPRIALIIEDDGMGIDAETLERMFEPFAQADRSLDRSRGGLGLGLALVKGLVELHGGDIEAASAGAGRGARFTATFPTYAGATATNGRDPRKSAAQAPTQSRRVLVIEDNTDAAESLRDVLEAAGHEVFVAYDGPAGLAKALELNPEVILCDLGLPGMDGYELARALQANLREHPALLVALTGYAAPEDERRTREAGFEKHLAKPVGVEQLYRVVSEPSHAH